MRIERLSAHDVERLGGPDGRRRAPALARRRRRLGRGGGARDPGQRCAPRATPPCSTTRAGSTPPATSRGRCSSPRRSSTRRSRGSRCELIAGLQVAIANVALVADAGVGQDAAVELPQGQRIVLREVPVGSAAVYVPGGRAPYPSTVVMGVVTARCRRRDRRGRVRSARRGRTDRPGDPRHLPAVRRGARLPHGRRPGDRRARLRHRDGRPRRRDRRPRQPVRAGGQAPALGDASASTASPARATCSSRSAHDLDERELRLAALDMLAQAEHGEGSLVAAVSPSAAVLRRARRSTRRARRRAPDGRRGGVRARRGRRRPRGGRRWPTRSRPSTCS